MSADRWPADEQFADFVLGGWWLENFIKVELPSEEVDPESWTREAMVARFHDSPTVGGLW
jgi:hypothetical protein